MGKKKKAGIATAALFGGGAALVFITQKSLKPQDPNVDPINGNISASSRTIIEGDTVTFNANPTGGNGQYNVNWAFGDGTSGSGLSVSHRYNNSGQYTVSATIRDGSGRKITEFININVGTLNNPPSDPEPDPEPIPDVIQGFDVFPKKGQAPLSVNASLVVGDPRSQIVIDWGDGNVTNNQLEASHTYFSNGNFTVKATVTDPTGRIDSRSVSISVTDKQVTDLISNFGPPKSSGAVNTTEFSSSIALSVTQNEVDITWDWGDGFIENNTLQSSHIYQQSGTFNGSVTVTKDGITDSRSFTISVSSSAGAPSGEIVVTGKSESKYDFFANFQGLNLQFDWDFGDGSPRELTNNQEISHTYTKTGTFTVLVDVIDSNGEMGSDTVQVSVRETDLQAELGDVQIQRLTNTTFDYSWKLVNITERFLNLEYTLRVFNSIGDQLDSRIIEFGLDAFESLSVDYNLPSLPDGQFNLELEVQDVNTKQLVAFDSIIIEGDGTGDDTGDPIDAGFTITSSNFFKNTNGDIIFSGSGVYENNSDQSITPEAIIEIIESSDFGVISLGTSTILPLETVPPKSTEPFEFLRSFGSLEDARYQAQIRMFVNGVEKDFFSKTFQN